MVRHDQQVKNFAKVMAEGLARRAAEPAADVWPAPRADLTLGDFYSAPVLLPHLASALERVEDDQRIADAFHRPSRPAHLMYLFLQEPCSPEDGLRRLSVASRLLRAIGLLRSGDTFATKGANLVLHDWREVTAEVMSRPVSATEAREVGVLSSALSTYCEYLYFAHLAYGREIHGPYLIDHERSLIVRDYYDLKPPHWMFPKALSFDVVSIYLVVRNVRFTFDFVGRMAANASIPQAVEAAMVVVDGETLGLAEVRPIVAALLSSLSDAKSESLAMSEGELLTQWVRGQFWAAKPVLDIAGLGEAWPMPGTLESVLREASGPSWLTRRFGAMSRLTIEDRAASMERLFDPGRLSK